MGARPSFWLAQRVTASAAAAMAHTIAAPVWHDGHGARAAGVVRRPRRDAQVQPR